MILLIGTPIRGTIDLSQEMARMAMPALVRWTTKSRSSIKTSERAITSTCKEEMDKDPMVQVVLVSSGGMCLG